MTSRVKLAEVNETLRNRNLPLPGGAEAKIKLLGALLVVA
jgi:hypothetical protein